MRMEPPTPAPVSALVPMLAPVPAPAPVQGPTLPAWMLPPGPEGMDQARRSFRMGPTVRFDDPYAIGGRASITYRPPDMPTHLLPGVSIYDELQEARRVTQMYHGRWQDSDERARKFEKRYKHLTRKMKSVRESTTSRFRH
jgi:hypothetical protein